MSRVSGSRLRVAGSSCVGALFYTRICRVEYARRREKHETERLPHDRGCYRRHACHPIPQVGGWSPTAGTSSLPPDFELAELTIADLQQGMRAGKYTSRGLCEQYLARIDALDARGPAIRAVLETNPDALSIAAALDAERRAKGPRGPLHGIPVLIKDNVATADRLATAAGSLALLGAKAAARLVRRRAAARCRRRDPRQDQHERMGQLPLQPLVERLERTRRAGAEPLRPRPESLRIELGLGRRRGREPLRGGRGHRDRRLDRLPLGRARARGHQADGRPGEPRRHHPHRAQPGHRRGRWRAPSPTPACCSVRWPAWIRLPPRAGARLRRARSARACARRRIGVARAKFFGYHAPTDRVVEDAIDAMRKLGAVIVDPADIPHAGEYDDPSSKSCSTSSRPT